MNISIERVSDVNLPKIMHEDDAGFDLPSAEDRIIKAGEKAIIKTGLKMAIPKGYVGLIWDRSGLAAKHSVTTLAGVIDSGYRGEIGIVLINHSDKEFQIEKNMRIAQMLIQKKYQPSFVEVENIDSDTERGSGSFGSSGNK
jgi:dUTP pyrophosphatase